MADKKVSQEEDYLDTYPSGSRSTHLVEVNVPGVDSYKLPLEGGNSLMTLVDGHVQPQMAQLGIAIVSQSEADAQARADAAQAAAIAAAATDATTKSNAAVVNAHSYTDAAVADITGGGGGGSGSPGLFPGPLVSPMWQNPAKKNCFPMAMASNSIGLGWVVFNADYMVAGPFAFAVDMSVTSLIIRSQGGDPGARLRMAIYRSDPDSYDPTTLMWEGIDHDGTFAGYYTEVVDLTFDAGKVYWATFWVGVADMPIYTRATNQDFDAVRIIGSDNDDATTNYVGIKHYHPWDGGTFPVAWPIDNGVDIAPTQRAGDRGPFFYATRD
jgi:hypothetical protein